MNLLSKQKNIKKLPAIQVFTYYLLFFEFSVCPTSRLLVSVGAFFFSEITDIDLI